MIPGSRIIPNCFDGVCEGGGDPEIEIPDAGFTQAIANATYTYSVSEDFTAPLPHISFTYNATGAGWACNNSFGGVVGPTRYQNPWDSISVSINQTINKVTTYSMVQKTKVTPGPGAIYRPGTEITICGGDAACYKYDFQVTSSVETLNTGQANIEFVTGDDYRCCDVIPYEYSNQTISTGPSITRNCSAGPFYFLYACVARFDVPGLFLTIKSAGVAIGPWDIQVSGSIVMTSSTGVVLVYSGLLNSVVSQINADGYFTATVAPGVVSSEALTSDFETGSASVVSGSTTCQTQLIIKKAGTPLAPSSQWCRAGFYNTGAPGSGACSIQFQKDQGYPDTEDGLLAWLAGEFSSPVLNFPDIPGGPGGCGYGMGYYYPVSSPPYFPGDTPINQNNCWTAFTNWSKPGPFKGNGTGISSVVLTFDDATYSHQHYEATFTEVISQPVVVPASPPYCICPDLTNSGQTNPCGNNPNSISATGLGGIPSCASYYCDAPGSTCCPGATGSFCYCDSCCCYNCGSFTENNSSFTKTYSLFQSIEGSFTLS